LLNHNIRKSVALSLYRDNLQPYKYTNILYENNFIVNCQKKIRILIFDIIYEELF